MQITSDVIVDLFSKVKAKPGLLSAELDSSNNIQAWFLKGANDVYQLKTARSRKSQRGSLCTLPLTAAICVFTSILASRVAIFLSSSKKKTRPGRSLFFLFQTKSSRKRPTSKNLQRFSEIVVCRGVFFDWVFSRFFLRMSPKPKLLF